MVDRLLRTGCLLLVSEAYLPEGKEREGKVGKEIEKRIESNSTLPDPSSLRSRRRKGDVDLPYMLSLP